MTGTRVVEAQIVKARDILAAKIPLSKYIRENKLGYADGASGKICCPVHDENTASFYYDDHKGRCNCFGCGVGGTVVELNFHVQKNKNHRYTMVRSINDLARDYNVEVPNLYERSTEEKEWRKPSRRRRGVVGRDAEWIYREKLLGLEGRVLVLPANDRLHIAGLMDDVWLGVRTSKEVYREITRKIRGSGQG